LCMPAQEQKMRVGPSKLVVSQKYFCGGIKNTSGQISPHAN
jgi:hypothetical protein